MKIPSHVLPLAYTFAHLLNGPNGNGLVDVAFVHQGIEAFLVRSLRRSRRGGSDMFFHHLYSHRFAVDEAAEEYRTLVLTEEVGLVRDRQPSNVHRLFAALCRRAPVQGWEAAEVRRLPDDTTNDRSRGQTGVQALDRPLARIAAHTAAAIAAEPPGRNKERIWLVVGDQRVPLPDRMSLIKAIAWCPRLLKPSTAGTPEFLDLVHLAVRTLENAEDTFRELCRLGVDPFAWLPRIARDGAKAGLQPDGTVLFSRNQLGEANKWRTRAEKLGTERGRFPGDPDILAEAWVATQVPGFKGDMAEFLRSDLGQAAVAGPAAPIYQVEADDRTIPIDLLSDRNSDTGSELLQTEELRRLLALARSHGWIDELEEKAFAMLGRSAIEDLRGDSRIARRCAALSIDVAEWLEDIIRRVRQSRRDDRTEQAPRLSTARHRSRGSSYEPNTGRICRCDHDCGRTPKSRPHHGTYTCGSTA